MLQPEENQPHLKEPASKIDPEILSQLGLTPADVDNYDAAVRAWHSRRLDRHQHQNLDWLLLHPNHHLAVLASFHLPLLNNPEITSQSSKMTIGVMSARQNHET